jgi:uncharacterized tellurite resistance protein B-like protein
MTLRTIKFTPPVIDKHAKLQRLLENTLGVAGMSGLSPGHTQFLYAALLVSIVTADDMVRHEELDFYAHLVTEKLNLPQDALEPMTVFISNDVNAKELALTSSGLRYQLDVEQRVELLRLLWEHAISDASRHPQRVEPVRHITKVKGVTGLHAAEEKMSLHNGKFAMMPKQLSNDNEPSPA